MADKTKKIKKKINKNQLWNSFKNEINKLGGKII